MNLDTRLVSVHLHYYPERKEFSGSMEVEILGKTTTVLIDFEEAARLIEAAQDAMVSRAEAPPAPPSAAPWSPPSSFGGDYETMSPAQQEEEASPFLHSYTPRKQADTSKKSRADEPRTLPTDHLGNALLPNEDPEDDDEMGEVEDGEEEEGES